nr:MAG TPA: hypothetical protein [Caudoviricetes sp.]
MENAIDGHFHDFIHAKAGQTDLMHTLPSEAGAVLHLQSVVLVRVGFRSFIVTGIFDLLVVILVVVCGKGFGVSLNDAENLLLHTIRQGGCIQKVRVGNQVGHILDVAQLRQSGCAVATVKGGIQTGDSSTHRKFTSLVSVNHSVLSDCCPVAAINPIDGIVVQPIQRGKRLSIEIERFQYRIHDSNDGTSFCNASAGFVGIDTHTQRNSGVLAVPGRINVYRQIAVFLYLHTRKLFDVAVVDFAGNKDAGDLLSQFHSNSREDGVEIINQLLQTSLHVAST